MILSKMFSRSDDSDDDGPLQRSVDWCRQQQQQQFIVVAHERQSVTKSYREYEACEMRSFFRRYSAQSSAARHCNEVLFGAVSLYFDIEFALDVEQPLLDDGQQFLQCVRHAAERMLMAKLQTSVVRWIDLDASRAGYKFSHHLVAHMQRDGAPVAFKSTGDCGEFVADLDDELCAGKASPIDRSVYSRNHLMRMIGSTKINDPSRPLLMADGEPLNFDTFKESLISRVGDKCRVIEYSGTGRARSNPRRTASPAQHKEVLACGSDLTEALQTIEEIEEAGISKVSVDAERLMVFVQCHSRFCAQKNAVHRSNHIYYVVDLLRGRYVQRCFSEQCPRSHQWRALPTHACETLRHATVADERVVACGVRVASELLG